MTYLRSGAAASMLLLAFVMAPAVAWAQAEEHKRPSQVLHLFERATGDLAFIDQGAPGPSIGDRLVYSAAIYCEPLGVGIPESPLGRSREARPPGGASPRDRLH